MQNIKILIIGVLSLLIIAACQKETTEMNPEDSFKNAYQLDESINLTTNYLSAEQYLLNNEDADDEKINTILFEIALVARDLFVDNTFNKAIITEAKKHDNSCISLDKFISTYYSNDHQTTFNNLEILTRNADLTHKSTNPSRNGEIEVYIPAIFVVNAHIADYTKLPIISPGISVNSSLPGMEKYDDYIVAWVYDGNGGFTEFLLNEETAMTTTHPVFAIDNAEEDITNRPKSNTNYENPKHLKNQETSWYSSYEYQINHRYESSGNSEFCITGAHITESGSHRLICKKDNGTYDTWKKIAEVHKNNIGGMLYHWEQFCDNNVTPLNTNYIFWNTYERDWYKSEKDLGNATRNGKTIYLNGRRKNSGDWYAYNPSQLNNNPVALNTIYWNWAKWHNNSKGKFRIWRIQP